MLKRIGWMLAAGLFTAGVGGQVAHVWAASTPGTQLAVLGDQLNQDGDDGDDDDGGGDDGY